MRSTWAPTQDSRGASAGAAAGPPARAADHGTVARALDEGRSNNFDFMRFVAAALVIVAHAFPLSYGDGSREALFRLSGGQTDFGSLAVAVFFVISGFLITRSYDRNPNPLLFATNRSLRIFPGLLLAVLFCAFVLGPLVTELSFADYFGQRGTYSYLQNVSLRYSQHELPGVFAANPYAPTVNGSLWTLWYEFLCYGVVLLLGVLRLLRWQVLAAGLAFSLLVVNGWLPVSSSPVLELLRLRLNAYEPYFRFFAFFAGGGLVYLMRGRVRLVPWLALSALTTLVAALVFGLFNTAFALAGSYLVVYLAFWRRSFGERFARHGDWSYGVYVYAFPVQQTVTELLLPNPDWLLNVLFTYPVVLLLAAASWHGVEKPALALKSKLGFGQVRAAAPRPT